MGAAILKYKCTFTLEEFVGGGKKYFTKPVGLRQKQIVI